MKKKSTKIITLAHIDMATTTSSNSERRTLQSSQKERGCFFAYSSHSLIHRTINVTIAYVLYTFITFLLIGFTLYIVFRFWTKPTSEWVTASDYGSSVYGAVFICAHWVGGVLVNLCGELSWLGRHIISNVI